MLKSIMVIKMLYKRIKELRKEKGITQVNVSTNIGVEESYYGKYERGEKKQPKPTAPPAPAPVPDPEPVQERQPSAAGKEINPAQDLEYKIEAGTENSNGLGMRELTEVRGDDDPDEEDNPPR